MRNYAKKYWRSSGFFASSATFLFICLAYFSLMSEAIAGDKVIVGEYPKGWNGINYVAIKQAFYVKDYQQIDVLFDFPSRKMPSPGDDGIPHIETAVKSFVERFFAELRREKDEINFVLAKDDNVKKPEQTVNQLAESISQINNGSTNTPSLGITGRLTLTITLKVLHAGSRVGSAFIPPVPFIPWQVFSGVAVDGGEYFGPFSGLLITGKITDAGSGNELVTFVHTQHGRVSVFGGHESTFNKLIDNTASDVANFLGDFS